MPTKILFAGDANLDLILSDLERAPQEDREVFCAGYASALGGSSALTAAAYAHLGGVCDFCGTVGDDANGSIVRDALAEAGVGLALLKQQPGEKTGVTVNLVRAATRTQITYPGCLSSLDETGTILFRLKNYSHVHLSGLYGTKRFLPRATEVLEAARSAGVTASLDTQWDSSEKWRYADEWMPLLKWLFVNEAEARSLARRYRSGAGKEPGLQETWESLRTLTPAPIIKLGAQGAYAAGTLRPPFEIEAVIDPTGAGDSFAAGFLYATLEAGHEFDSAIRYALAAGALACSFESGSSNKFKKEKVESIVRGA